jgi:hypothetical protein
MGINGCLAQVNVFDNLIYYKRLYLKKPGAALLGKGLDRRTLLVGERIAAHPGVFGGEREGGRKAPWVTG